MGRVLGKSPLLVVLGEATVFYREEPSVIWGE